MQIEVDVINDVVLLVDKNMAVLDAFPARGITRYTTQAPVHFYVYRSMLAQPGSCAVCGYAVARMNEHCSSSGGFHAFVGVDDDADIPAQHKAANRSLPLHMLTYDELVFYVVPDNLFEIDRPQKGMIV